MSEGSNRSFLWAVVAGTATFGGFAALLWYLGLFEFDGTDSSAKVVAASLGLVGALFAAMVPMIGLFVKHSLEQRNLQLKEQAEERLKLEAAIRAVDLMGTSDGKPAAPIQQAGSIIALTNLRQYGLALALLDALLQSDGIDATSAATVVDKCLLLGDLEYQETAMGIFMENAGSFIGSDGHGVLPDPIMNWSETLTKNSKFMTLRSLGGMLLAQPLEKWARGDVSGIIGTLMLAWKKETDATLKNELGVVLKALKGISSTSWSTEREGHLMDFLEIQNEVSSCEPHMYEVSDVAEQLREWCKEGGLYDD